MAKKSKAQQPAAVTETISLAEIMNILDRQRLSVRIEKVAADTPLPLAVEEYKTFVAGLPDAEKPPRCGAARNWGPIWRVRIGGPKKRPPWFYGRSLFEAAAAAIHAAGDVCLHCGNFTPHVSRSEE